MPGAVLQEYYHKTSNFFNGNTHICSERYIIRQSKKLLKNGANLLAIRTQRSRKLFNGSFKVNGNNQVIKKVAQKRANLLAIYILVTIYQVILNFLNPQTILSD